MQKGRQADRKADRQIERQTGRQTQLTYFTSMWDLLRLTPITLETSFSQHGLGSV